MHKYKPRGQNRPRPARVPLMPDAENVTRWIVDQQFRDTQIQLGIPLGQSLTCTKNLLACLV